VRLLGRLEPLLEVRVPDVLDLVVRPPGQPGGNGGPPVTKEFAELISALSVIFQKDSINKDI
jgi:hypothetical protein